MFLSFCRQTLPSSPPLGNGAGGVHGDDNSDLFASPLRDALCLPSCNGPGRFLGVTGDGGADVVAYRSLAWSADDAARAAHLADGVIIQALHFEGAGAGTVMRAGGR